MNDYVVVPIAKNSAGTSSGCRASSWSAESLSAIGRVESTYVAPVGARTFTYQHHELCGCVSGGMRL